MFRFVLHCRTGDKKRHHKKSKKARKHKSKRKESSDSDSDSSNSSDNASDADIVKRKKQKKHKKSKRRHRHESKANDSVAEDSDAKEAPKGHYPVAGGNGNKDDDDGSADERHRLKRNKRIDEMKKLRGSDATFEEKTGIKSKWDSPKADDFDTKR